MKAIRSVQGVCAVFGFLLSAAAWAGNPVAINGTGSTSFTAAGVGSTTTQTITLTFNAAGNVGANAALNALAFAGTNAPDFAIVGGTCAPETTQLSPTNPTCTVIVQYHASSAATESATLTGSCTQVSLVGGFILSCNGATGNLQSLVGAVLAAVAQLPFLDPKMLTLLCAFLLGIGGYFASRKNG